MKFNNRSKLTLSVIVLTSATLLTACGSESDDSIEQPDTTPAGGITVTTAEAKQLAVNSMTQPASQAAGQLSAATNHPSFDNIEGFLDEEDSSTGFSAMNESDDDIGEALESLMGELTGHLFENADRDGLVITYTADPDKVCTVENNVAPEDIADCQEVISKLSVVQTLTGNETGTLALYYDGNEPFSLDYAPNEVSYFLNLGDLYDTVAALPTDDDAFDDTDVDQLEGTLSLTFSSSETVNSISVGVPSAIAVVGKDEDGNDLSFNFAESPTAFTFSHTLANDNVEIDVNIGAVVANYFESDFNEDFETVLYPVAAQLSALTGNILLDSENEKVVVSNGSLGNDGFETSINNVRTFDINASNFSFEIREENSSAIVTATDDLSLSVFQKNTLGLAYDTFNSDDESLEGEISVTVANGTAFEEHGLFNTVTEVVAGGSIVATGTGAFLGNMTATPGMCFTDENEDSLFPFMVVDCPQ